MTRIRGERVDVPGWGGVVEDADASVGFDGAKPIGVMDSCVNFVPTGTGRLAVRGGSTVKLTLEDGAANAMSSVLAQARYSQVGTALVAHRAAASKHYGFLYSADLSSLVARTDLGWNSATAARPRIVELFERVFIADANRSLASRQQMVSLTAAGVLTAMTADLGSGAEALKPYCIATYNNHLFVAGQDAGGVSSPAMVRHSFLGRSPDAANGFQKDAYAIIGSQGEFVTAMVPGESVLLVAKERELYRLSGFGRGVDGWQFAVQQLDNTEYVGVKWPGALTHAEGWWYGVGEAGPFATDGKQIDVLVAPRRRSWRAVGSLDKAIVRYDPERRLILFGFVTTGATDVRALWLWDIDAEQWVGEWTLPIGVSDVFPLATGTAPGPTTAAPSAATIDHPSATLTSVAGTFTAGDAASQTEVWADTGAGFSLRSTLASGVTSFTVTGLPSTTRVPVKLRHAKDGIPGPFSAETTAYTLLAPPTLVQAAASKTTIDLDVTQNADAADLFLERDGSPFMNWSAQPIATLSVHDGGLSCGTGYAYAAYATLASWPAAINTSDVTLLDGETSPCT